MIPMTYSNPEKFFMSFFRSEALLQFPLMGHVSAKEMQLFFKYLSVVLVLRYLSGWKVVKGTKLKIKAMVAAFVQKIVLQRLLKTHVSAKRTKLLFKNLSVLLGLCYLSGWKVVKGMEFKAK